MAKERGWWDLSFSAEPNGMDLESVASLVLEGYTEGEILGESGRGWWNLSTTVEPDDSDLLHISMLIADDFTSGEIL